MNDSKNLVNASRPVAISGDEGRALFGSPIHIDRNFLITAVELFRRSCVVVNIDRDPEGAL
jgi:hypothetical protein